MSCNNVIDYVINGTRSSSVFAPQIKNCNIYTVENSNSSSLFAGIIIVLAEMKEEKLPIYVYQLDETPKESLAQIIRTRVTVQVTSLRGVA